MKALLKKGLVLCMIGVMSFSIMACGGNNSTGSTEPATKTESQESTGAKENTQTQGTTEQPSETQGQTEQSESGTN